MRLAAVGTIVLFMPFAVAVGPTGTGLETLGGAWLVDTVDANLLNAFTINHIAIGPDGMRHVLYTYFAPNRLTYAKETSNGWQKTTIAPYGIPAGIHVDEAGTVHLGWRQDNLLTHTVISAVGMISETVDATPWRLSYAELETDAQDAVHFIYASAHDAVVRYAARLPNGTWQREIVDTLGIEPALEVTPEGVPHVVYTNWEETGPATYRWKTASGWARETVDGCAVDVDVTVDASGTPHVSCHGSGDGLVYATRGATGWTWTRVAPGSLVGFDSVIVVDAGGTIHIAYKTNFNPFFPDWPFSWEQPYYATRTAAGWVIERPDPDGTGNGVGPGLALDDEGRPHMVYVLAWRSRTLSPHDTLNPYFDLRVATPLGAVAERALPDV